MRPSQKFKKFNGGAASVAENVIESAEHAQSNSQLASSIKGAMTYIHVNFPDRIDLKEMDAFKKYFSEAVLFNLQNKTARDGKEVS